MARTAADGDPEGLAVVTGERSVPPVTLRSVQQYRSQDEYVVVMKEDLADWFNELYYDTTMTGDDLFDRLETGVLLCRYACTVDDVIGSRDVPVVYRERGAEPGSFQARVNVAAFLAWCRRAPLCLTDDMLFETGDLICAERNERQVALCLLEVGRRSAALRLGLPAPQLIRLEQEIDAEMGADDDSATTSDDDFDHDDDDDDDDDKQSPSNASTSFAAGTRRSAARRIKPPSVIVSRQNGVEGPTSAHSTRGGDAEMGADDDSGREFDSRANSERSGSVWQRRRYRPVIPVDMMSLDEMVRQILGRCSCPTQYPMIRVSEGKYRVGDNLTLIFVRVLRQHVMVRIGGGWNTLDNYLARCDPCRCQKNSSSTAVSPTTGSSSRSPTSNSKEVSQRQRHPLSDDRLNSHLMPPSSQVTMTTVATSGQQQQPTTRRPSDLLLTSKALPVCDVDYRSASADHVDELMTETDDVRRESAETCCSPRGSDSDAVCPDSTSTRNLAVPSSTSSSPPDAAPAAAAAAASTAVEASCSCRRLMCGDDVRRTHSCRRSRIPVPLRVAALCRSHSANVLRVVTS